MTTTDPSTSDVSTSGPTASNTDLEGRREALAQSGWGRSFHLVQWRNLAFWLYVFLVGWGVLALLQLTLPGTQIAQGSLAATSAIFALYSIPFVLFLRHLDRFGTVPGPLALAAFVWGGLAATAVIAVHGNDALHGMYEEAFGPAFALNWANALSAPFNEELGKAAGLLLLVLLAPRLIRTAFDGLLVGSFLGLGFQIVENVIYGFRGGSGGFDIDNIGAAVHSAVMRMGVGVFSHWLYSGIFCAGLIWFLGRPNEPAKRLRGLVLMAIAMITHGLWDAASGMLNTSIFFLPLSYLLVPLTLVFTYRWIYRTSVTTERAWAKAVLAPEVTSDVATQAEVDAFAGSHKERNAYVHSAAHHKGHVGARHVLEALRDLLHALSRSGGEDSAEVTRSRDEILRVRGTTPIP